MFITSIFAIHLAIVNAGLFSWLPAPNPAPDCCYSIIHLPINPPSPLKSASTSAEQNEKAS